MSGVEWAGGEGGWVGLVAEVVPELFALSTYGAEVGREERESVA